MFSIVCVYSDRNVLNRFLFPSLMKQNVEYEEIFIDNCNGQFASAASAFNYAGKKATSKYIMFVHQDVDFESGTWLADAEKLLDNLSDLGIAGVAGISETGHNLRERGRNIIKHGPERFIWEFGNAIDKPQIVQTLDCCLLMIPNQVFQKLQFDDITCNNWHLYAEDYCLSIKLMGLNAYVIPLSIYHGSRGIRRVNRLKILLSLGALPAEYYDTLKKLIQKHKEKYKYIYTTNGEWNTFQPIFIQRIFMLLKGGFDYILRSIKGIFKYEHS